MVPRIAGRDESSSVVVSFFVGFSESEVAASTLIGSMKMVAVMTTPAMTDAAIFFCNLYNGKLAKIKQLCNPILELEQT